MEKTTLIILLLAVTIAGCRESTTSKPVAPPRPLSSAATATAAASELHNTIKRYNQLLIEGYKTTNMTPLQEVATKELSEKAYYHMAAIGEGKSRMVSELKKIDFLETDCSRPPHCRVISRELWDFGYVDILTGKKANEVKDYIYDVQYLLESRQGRWIITEINATGEERKEMPSWKNMMKGRS